MTDVVCPQPATTASAYSLVEEDPRWLGVADDLSRLDRGPSCPGDRLRER